MDLVQHAPAISLFPLAHILADPFAQAKNKTLPTFILHELPKRALVRLVLATSRR